MKKIFTVLLLFFICAGYGQSLQLIFDGQSYNDNDTATVVVGNPGGDNDYYIDVVNLTDSVIDLMVKKTELYEVSGTENVFCFGRSCYTGNQSSEPVAVQPGDTFSHENYPDNAFHIIYSPDNNLGTTIIKYTFFDQNDTTVASGLVIKFITTSSLQYYASSLSLLAYPNPAVSNVTIKYDMGKSDFSSAELVVKNFMGVTIYSKKLMQSSDKVVINLSNFSSGVYFYSIQQCGKSILSKKLLVK